MAMASSTPGVGVEDESGGVWGALRWCGNYWRPPAKKKEAGKAGSACTRVARRRGRKSPSD